MFSRLIPAVALVAVALGLQAGVARDATAASGGGCQLAGTANLNPGLNMTARSYTYSFSGALSSCQASDATAPAAGNVAAGVQYAAVTSSGPDPANPTVTITHTEHFIEPASTGTGTCANSTTGGTAFVTWSDASTTIISYTTSGAGAEVLLQGTVIPSFTLTAADHTYTWEPATLTATSTRYGGSSALANLVFQATPTDCNSATGVQTAGISGATILSSSN
jgi:hypothetical protein